MIIANKTQKHYITGDLNSAVGNTEQKVEMSQKALEHHYIKRTLINNNKDTRGRWLQNIMNAQDYIVANGTKGDGLPTHWGKGTPSIIDLAIANITGWRHILDFIVRERIVDSDHCEIALYLSKPTTKRKFTSRGKKQKRMDIDSIIKNKTTWSMLLKKLTESTDWMDCMQYWQEQWHLQATDEFTYNIRINRTYEILIGFAKEIIDETQTLPPTPIQHWWDLECSEANTKWREEVKNTMTKELKTGSNPTAVGTSTESSVDTKNGHTN
jgi:hypothetical protein